MTDPSHRALAVKLSFVQPDPIPWDKEVDGDLSDVFRIWNDVAGTLGTFALFIARQSLTDNSIIVACYGIYAMLNHEGMYLELKSEIQRQEELMDRLALHDILIERHLKS